MAVQQEDIDRFLALYKGNPRSFGVFNPNSRTHMTTVKSEYTDEHVRSHLEGELGLGMVPILDDGTCWWAALDIDVHGPNKVDVDLSTIEQKVTRSELPLVVCRSKSGGAHCYLFLKEATPVVVVRAMLARWAATLGHPQAEIFPKQVSLDPPKGESERPLGNWINLPYYDADKTERWAIDGGKQVTFEYFLELAEGRRTLLEDFADTAVDDYVNGPPCLQRMLDEKVDEGGRNTAMFQAAVYLKRAFGENWRDKAGEFNRGAFVAPLDNREFRIICNSVNKKDYQYKCREEPCRTLCNRELCKTREFGITDGDAAANEIPLFENVQQVIATPIRWILTVKGKVIEVTTPELFNYETVRQRVGEKLHIVLPRIKSTEWDQYLREIMKNVEIRHETTVEDQVFAKLCEFLRRGRTDKSRPEMDRRDDLRRGVPTLIAIERSPTFEGGKLKRPERGTESWYYAFRIGDFIEYLRKKKALPCPDHQIATILYRVLGEDAKRDKIRVADGKRIGNVWCIAETHVDSEEVPVKNFSQEY
jgi:hypothetical protein